MLSLPHSAKIFPPDRAEARQLVREWNDFMAKLAADHPGRFGNFAAVPLPVSPRMSTVNSVGATCSSWAWSPRIKGSPGSRLRRISIILGMVLCSS